MKHNYHICPIRAVENEIDISCSYVFLTRRDDIDVQPNVLLLDVLDTEEERHPYRFTNEHARKILEFIENSGIEDVFVCCDQGESRSAGVAAALIELEGGDSSYIWKSSEYHPNRLFYKTMKEVLQTYKEIKI